MQTQQTLGDTRRALLLTDVVDSTRISLAAGEAEMARMWAAHDRAARELLLTWNGREIDKTDGLLALFDRAADAAGYALAYHQALAALGLPFRARVGLHVGPLALRENSAADVERGAKRFEVDGMAKPIVARVMATARGGQTLISAAAREAIAVEASDASSNAMRIESHGHWRFKGLPEPMELFEIGDDAAPFTPPPDEAKAYRVVRRDTPGSTAAPLWQPVREIKHSMPAERDSFVGRDEPLRWLADKLDRADVRLVSVLGIGGTGKTRFVTRYAWTWLGDYPGGVWFCDLAQARTLDGIYFAVAQGLDVPLGKTDPAIQLAHAIAGRGECLVIFDNFEQVAKHAEETIGRWLDRAPKAKFIVTTREVLGIVGEETLMLDPLPVDDAADLFVRRARAAKHDFRVRDDDERAAVRKLVRVLDGLPLAIELAAARVRMMTPGVLLSKMNERFDVLLSRAGRNDRQATLRAALDWSWELLSDAERSCLAQLSMFDGGFALDAAEAVVEVAETGSSALRVGDLLGWLADKSLVRSVDGVRFEVLGCVQEYAAGQLGKGVAVAREDVANRHWRYYATLDDRQAASHRCADAMNLVIACRRATLAGAGSEATRCLEGAWAALRLTGPFRIASDLAAELLTLIELSPPDRAIAAWVAGGALDAQGIADAAKRAFYLGLECADGASTRVRLLLGIAEQEITRGEHDRANSHLHESLRVSRELHDASLEAYALASLGRLEADVGSAELALKHYSEALRLVRGLEDQRREGGLLNNIGIVLFDSGKFDEAEEHYRWAIELAETAGDKRWRAGAQCNVGLLWLQRGDVQPAIQQFDACLQLARELGYIRLEYTVLCNLGIAMLEAGDSTVATDFLQEATAIARANGDHRSEGRYHGYLAVALARSGRQLDARASLNVAQALLEPAADARGLVMLHCQRAEIEWATGRAQAARNEALLAQRLCDKLPHGPDAELVQMLAKINLTVSAKVEL